MADQVKRTRSQPLGAARGRGSAEAIHREAAGPVSRRSGRARRGLSPRAIGTPGTIKPRRECAVTGSDTQARPGVPCGASQRPLRFRPTSLIPFFSPSSLTTSSLAGTVKLRRGEMQIPTKNLGTSSALLATPRAARPFRTRGDAFSIRIS